MPVSPSTPTGKTNIDTLSTRVTLPYTTLNCWTCKPTFMPGTCVLKEGYTVNRVSWVAIRVSARDLYECPLGEVHSASITRIGRVFVDSLQWFKGYDGGWGAGMEYTALPEEFVYSWTYSPGEVKHLLRFVGEFATITFKTAIIWLVLEYQTRITTAYPSIRIF